MSVPDNPDSPRAQIAKILTRKPIYFQPAYCPLAKKTAPVCFALFLTQAAFWSGNSEANGGWFWKTEKDWESETNIQVGQQDAIRKELIALGILEVIRKGVPAKLFYRVDFERLCEILLAQSNQSDQTDQSSSVPRTELVPPTIQFGPQNGTGEAPRTELDQSPERDYKREESKEENKKRIMVAGKNGKRKPALDDEPEDFYDEIFMSWWDNYPKKVKKFLCAEIFWNCRDRKSMAAKINAGIDRYSKTSGWREGRIHDPATFLNNRMWGDETGSSNSANKYDDGDVFSTSINPGQQEILNNSPSDLIAHQEARWRETHEKLSAANANFEEEDRDANA